MRIAIGIAVTLLLLVAWAAPAEAKDRAEITFSINYTDADDTGERGTLAADLLYPVTAHQMIGPAIGLTYINLDDSVCNKKACADAPDDTAGRFGGIWEWVFGEEQNGVFVGAGASYLTGDLGDLFDYGASARVGVKYGGETVFAKAWLGWERLFADAADDDLDTLGLTAGIGWRF